jgi:hypothetical protein
MALKDWINRARPWPWRPDIGFRVAFNLGFWLCVLAPAIVGIQGSRPELTHSGIYRIVDFADHDLLEWQAMAAVLLSAVLFIVSRLEGTEYEEFWTYVRDDVTSAALNLGWLLILAALVWAVAGHAWNRAIVSALEGVLMLLVFIGYAEFESGKHDAQCAAMLNACTTNTASILALPPTQIGPPGAQSGPMGGWQPGDVSPWLWTSSYRSPDKLTNAPSCLPPTAATAVGHTGWSLAVTAIGLATHTTVTIRTRPSRGA